MCLFFGVWSMVDEADKNESLRGETTDEGVIIRRLEGGQYYFYASMAILMSGFVIWVNTFGFMESINRNAIYLGFTLALIFFVYPGRRAGRPGSKAYLYSFATVAVGVLIWLVWGEWFWGFMVAAGGLYAAALNTEAVYPSSSRLGWIDWTLIVIGIMVGLYTYIFWEIRQDSNDDPNIFDWTFAILAILIIVEATRRCAGPWLAVISVFFLIYGYFGNVLPSFLEFASHRGMAWDRLLEMMYLEDNGVYGITLGVASTFIFIFVLMGAFLSVCGTAMFFNELALAISGRSAGGPAKVAVIASGTMGTISGSAVANVATTGTFTIPLMKRIGYKPYYAGAVEAAASTGGLIMPPIMGTAAFIMVEYLSTSYLRIMMGAVIPAFLYYFAIFLQVHFAARKEGLTGLDESEIPKLSDVLREGIHLLVPIIMLIVTLFVSGRTALFAGGAGIMWALTIIFCGDKYKRFPVVMMFAAIALHIIVAILAPDGYRMEETGGLAVFGWLVNTMIYDSIYLVTLAAVFLSFELCVWRGGVLRSGIMGNVLLLLAFYLVTMESWLVWMAFPAALAGWYVLREQEYFQGVVLKLLDVLVLGARSSLSVGIACAIVGFVVGVAQSTSLSAVFAQNIVHLSGGVLFFALFFTMIASIISSMGLPATAVYIVVITVVIEALMKMGITDFPAHMFVFYFGILSNVTPPVALASYTAAGISGGTPWEVGWTAFRITMPGFIIPYMFVYEPALLLEGSGFVGAFFPFLAALAAVFAMSIAGEGYLFNRITPYERIIMFVSAGLLAFPGVISPVVGAWLGGGMALAAWPVAAAGVLLLGLGVASQWIRRRDVALEIGGA